MTPRKALLAAGALLSFLVLSSVLVSSYRWIDRPFPGFFIYDNLTVGPDFLPHWSGRMRGLRFLDRLIAVESRALTRSADLYEIVRQNPPGTRFHYTIERDGRRLQIDVPSMPFTFYDWLLGFGSYLLTATGFLAIGSAPFFLRSTAPAATPLFLMVSAIFFWFASTFDFMTSQVLPKVVRIFAFTLTPSAGIHLGLELTRSLHGGARQRASLFSIYGLSFLMGLFYSLSFYGPAALWRFSLGIAYGYSFAASLVFLGLLWSALGRTIADLERCRLRVVSVGAIFGFCLPTLATVGTIYLSWVVGHNFLLVLVAVFPISVAYALLKYNLFDLDHVLKFGLSRIALTGILLLVYAMVVSLLTASLGIYETDLWVPVLFSVLVVLVFNPVLRWIEGLLDRYLYRKDYDPLHLQSEVSLLLRSLSPPQVLAQKYLNLIADRLGIKTAQIFFHAGEGRRPLTFALSGEAQVEGIDGGFGSEWMKRFGSRRGISRDEVEASPEYERDRAGLLRIFSALDSVLLIPISFQESILGFASFGKRRSGKEYGADDFKLLSNLTDQLALSLKNGMLFEESERAKESYRALYAQSQVLNRKLLEADRLKKEFVANISHELRTPISTILGYTEVLLDSGLRENVRAILERVVASGQDLSQLIDNLLSFSRFEAGSATTILQEVDLRELLGSLELMMRRLIRDRPIDFKLEIETATNVIETDPQKLQQILAELLINSVKFTPSGEILLAARAFYGSGDPFICISVTDTGIGITKRDQDVIFEEFRQLDGSSTRRYGGTGLGLSLCQRIARSLGARIEVDSELGRGSTFKLILPLRKPIAQLQAA